MTKVSKSKIKGFFFLCQNSFYLIYTYVEVNQLQLCDRLYMTHIRMTGIHCNN